jgi:hypothetical protein
MKCKICKTRKPKRFCPAVSGDICAICCGTEREVTLRCPLECEYLIASRQHERPPTPPASLPEEGQIDQAFLVRHRPAMEALTAIIVRASLSNDALDADLREAMDSLTQTYKTLDSGLYYESLPQNPIAAAIARQVNNEIEQFRQYLRERGAHETTATFLKLLQFYRLNSILYNNGKPYGRLCLHRLYLLSRDLTSQEDATSAGNRAEAPPPGSRLIVP